MSGNPASGKDDASGPVDAEAPAKEIQILETLRAMWQLVTFSPDDLPEAFANHFSLGQVAEMAARLEDARLVMEADQPPARPTPGSGPQRLWLAGGLAASPQRELEFRALPATAWTDFTQEEVDAMGPVMKQSPGASLDKSRTPLRPKLGLRPRSSLRRLPARRRRSTTLESPRPLWKR